MHTPRQPIVAIDGPAGSGKSTVAIEVARRAGLQFISSGSMYRAVALRALRDGAAAADRDRLVALAADLDIHFSTDADGMVHSHLHDEDVTDALRRPDVGQIASTIAVIPEVRAHLVAKQQAYGANGGIVMEGRDIQTVVFPDADLKFFIIASAEERARRRWKELRATGHPDTFDSVLAEVLDRDRRDAERAASPLRAADDAIVVETDGMSVSQVADCLIRIIDAWRAMPAAPRDALLAQADCTSLIAAVAKGF